MGAEVATPWGAIISGGASVLDSILKFFNQKSANKTNVQMTRETNAANMEIANRNNAMQVAMNRENNDFNRRMALEMFNLENAYNSPIEQMARLRAAGVNPALYFANSNGSAGVGDASTPSASSSGISPSMPNLVAPHVEPLPSLVGGSIAALHQLAQIYDFKASAEKKGAETNQINELLDDTIRNLRANTQNAEVEAAAKRWQNEMNYLWENSERSERLKEVTKRIAQIGADIQLKASEGKLNEAREKLADMEREFTNSRNTDLKARLPFVKSELERTIELLEEKIKTEKSQQSENYASAENQRASAGLTREQTSQLEDIHEFVVEEKRANASKATTEARLKFDTYLDELNRITNEAKLSKAKLDEYAELVRKARAAADMAEKENSSYYWRLALDTLGDIVQGAATVYGLKFLGRGLRGSKNEPKYDKPTNTYQRYHPENGLYY